MNLLRNYKRVALIPLLMLMLYSCMPGAGAPARKKWPELNGFQGAGGLTTQVTSEMGLPFQTGYTDMMMGNGMATLFTISLPGAGDDSAIMNLVNTYRPFAVHLLTQWAQQQNKGVLIDLRANAGQDLHRADYLVQREGAFSIPVVFLWDGFTAGRAAAYMNLLHVSPAVNVNQVSGESISFGRSQAGFGNCFPAQGLQ